MAAAELRAMPEDGNSPTKAAVLEALKQLSADAAFLASTLLKERADGDVRLRSLRNCPAEPRDRLDVLGLGSDIRLVVAELKRDVAPDPLYSRGHQVCRDGKPVRR